VEGLIYFPFWKGDPINLPSTPSIPSTLSTISKDERINQRRRPEARLRVATEKARLLEKKERQSGG